ncbi:hypothetical protein D3C86_1619710 [compost metagenome]
MLKGQEPMQRRINRRSFAGQVVDTMVKQLYHFIFMLKAPVNIFKVAKAVYIQCSEAIFFQGTQIAARAFYPHHFSLLAGKRIFGDGFTRSIASAIIG